VRREFRVIHMGILSVAGLITSILAQAPSLDGRSFGVDVCSVGDLDGDGCTDGWFADDTRAFEWGRNTVWVYSTKTRRPLYEIGSPKENKMGSDNFAHAIWPIEDVDKDGVDDLVIGATDISAGGGSWVAVYSGVSGKLIRILDEKDYSN